MGHANIQRCRAVLQAAKRSEHATELSRATKTKETQPACLRDEGHGANGGRERRNSLLHDNSLRVAVELLRQRRDHALQHRLVQCRVMEHNRERHQHRGLRSHALQGE